MPASPGLRSLLGLPKHAPVTIWREWYASPRTPVSVVATWFECGGRKTGKILWIPCTQELMRTMDTWERKPGYLVTRPDGLPYTRPMLSDEWWKECRRNAALAPLLASRLSFHGLRASAVIRLRRAGCSEGEIASMVGMSVPMVSRYCRRSEQRDNALAALARLGTPDEQNKVVPFKSGKASD